MLIWYFQPLEIHWYWALVGRLKKPVCSGDDRRTIGKLAEEGKQLLFLRCLSSSGLWNALPAHGPLLSEKLCWKAKVWLLGNWKSDQTSEKGQLSQAAWRPERKTWQALLVCDDFLLQTGQFSANTYHIALQVETKPRNQNQNQNESHFLKEISCRRQISGGWGWALQTPILCILTQLRVSVLIAVYCKANSLMRFERCTDLYVHQ